MKTTANSFFLFALGWSYAFWIVAAIVGLKGNIGSLLFFLGGAGPLVAAVLLIQFREPSAVQRDFWIRIVDVRRLGWPWWGIALFLYPAIVALAFAVDIALGGAPPLVEADVTSAWSVVTLVVFVFLFGPLPEEIGWRGFALDRLHVRRTALGASLVLGLAWALWHVPLFFIPGTYQAGLRLGSVRSGLFFATLLPLSVLMTWVYNNTAQSTLSAVLLHFSGNLTGAVFVKSGRVAALEFGLLTLAAVLVVLRWGPRSLRGRHGGPREAIPPSNSE